MAKHQPGRKPVSLTRVDYGPACKRAMSIGFLLGVFASIPFHAAFYWLVLRHLP